MCGIVVYFGDAKNPLTRILSGMWAIIYRAPDSTGIGMLGNDMEPLKIRKELGAVDHLIDLLTEQPLHDPGQIGQTLALETHRDHQAQTVSDLQKKLLALEGFEVSLPSFYPEWRQLTDMDHPTGIGPGTPGNPTLSKTLAIQCSDTLKQVVDTLTTDGDLPLAMVEKILARAFEK